jgi:hypothetical protein
VQIERHRQYLGASVVLGLALSAGLGGCSTATAGKNDQRSGSSAAATSAARTADASHAAVQAYLAFRAVSYQAERAPEDYITWLGKLNATAVDPARTDEEHKLFQDRALAWAYRGTPPTSRTSVQTIALDAKPYPSVIVADCPTVSATWRVFDIKKNKPLQEVFPSGTAKPPYPTTATVIYSQSHWTVQQINTDVRRTCTGR